MFPDWPLPCPDDPRDICTSGALRGVQATVARVIQASDGAPVETVVIPQSSLGRSLSSGLFDPGTRKPEEMAAVSDDSVTWTQPLASVFPTSGMSTSYGWDFDRVPAAGLFVGSVGVKPASSTKTTATYDLARYMTAGFTISGGATVWRDAGTWYACNFPLPCPGTLGDGYRPPVTGLRLRLKGTVRYSLYSPGVTPSPPVASPGTDVQVEGFDLTTGMTLWSYDAGADFSLIFSVPPLLGPYLVALPSRSGGMVALNLVTGIHTPVRPSAVAWCHSAVAYRTQVGWRADGKTQYDRYAEAAIRPCRVSGSPVAIPKSAPGFAGTVSDGLTVWSEANKVVAVPTSS
jgi:hypothetical protein